MGMDAYIMALGKFSGDVVGHLEYPAEFYSDTRPGSLVIGILFQCTTTEQSQQLARAFNIDPWNFSVHLLTAAAIEAADRLILANLPDGDSDLVGMDKLVEAGFRLIYRPEG